MYSAEEYFDLTHTLAGGYLKKFIYPWQALKCIDELISSLSKTLGGDFVEIGENAWTHKTARIAPTAYIGEWTIIGAHTEVRHCAFIRGEALLGDGCVIGNSAELKNAIIFDEVKIPHFNYVGDSILGYKCHIGAGAITSNVKSDKTSVTVNGVERIDTGLKKFGAIIGDFVEIGCNSVINPGTIIGKNTTVYPLTSVRGVIPANCIVKSGRFETVAKQDNKG